MTPERLHLLQRMLLSASFDWTYDDTRYLREPVELRRRWPQHENVVDLPVVKKVAFTMRKGFLYLTDRNGERTTETCELAWVEAEGVVISAEGFTNDGACMARDIIGMRCPIANKGRRRVG